MIEDKCNRLVKVSYIGHGSEYDECRLKDEIFEISEETSNASAEDNDSHLMYTSIHFSLFEELAFRIKSLLSSNRKGDPVCRIIMPFDAVSFDSLLIRSKALPKARLRKIYTVAKFDDILGDRWYIRGLNLEGDFCFIIPGSVKFYLKHYKGKVDFQMQSDGTVLKKTYGKGCKLIFSFVRGDGISTQWNEVITKCTSK